MWHRRDGRRLWVVVAIALLAMSLLSGCVQIEVLDLRRSEAVPTLIPIPAAGEHDLALLALNFEPPLDEEAIPSSEEVTLLVAVENMGVWKETNVRVEARLSSYDGKEVLLDRTGYIDVIAPGEIKVVRLRSPVRIPYRPVYLLEVQVSPVEREVHSANNHKSYEIRIERLSKRLP